MTFAGLLTLLFIALKLTHQISWSWWLVLLPAYAIPGALLAFSGFCVFMAWMTGQIGRRKISARRL